MPIAPTITIHLLANAHIDPVWLWDRQEGLAAAHATIRSVLSLMDSQRDLTFIRGESIVYEYVEQRDPDAWHRICEFVRNKRWDVVGGTYVQADTNLPSADSLHRQFEHGLEFFRSRFGDAPTAAWFADSFGHSAGLPAILASHGMRSIAFTRPSAAVVPIECPAFWWESACGARVLAYRPLHGTYLTERFDVSDHLTGTLRAAADSKLRNVACFYGLGDHGGGPTRRHLDDIAIWAADHPEVRVLHSGLHQFFDALRDEMRASPALELPVHRGELNPVFRGCYASALSTKAAYRQAEVALGMAERAQVLMTLSTASHPFPLHAAVESVLFNGFHDILPGTSIERATMQQVRSLGGAIEVARTARLDSLERLAAQVDTTVVPPPSADAPAPVAVLIVNHLPRAVTTSIEVEICLDDRPLFDFEGRADELPIFALGASGELLPFQRIATEHSAFPSLPWRARLLMYATLPAMGYSIWQIGVDSARSSSPSAKASAGSRGPGHIFNERCEVSAASGRHGVHLVLDGSPLLQGAGLGAAVVSDHFGSWGEMSDAAVVPPLAALRTWPVTATRVIESGPLRARLWVRLSDPADTSRIDFTFSLVANRDAVDVDARLFWNGRGCTLKLLLPCDAISATYDVPGATVERDTRGEVPSGRWIVANGLIFVSDCLCGSDLCNGVIRPTVVRGAPYAATEPWVPESEPYRPAMDAGQHLFRFTIARGGPEVARLLTEELMSPPTAVPVVASPGLLPREQSIFEVIPMLGLETISLRTDADGHTLLRLRNTTDTPVVASIRTEDGFVHLGSLEAQATGTWHIERDAHGSWRYCLPQ